jgi:hypothetical protein
MQGGWCTNTHSLNLTHLITTAMINSCVAMRSARAPMLRHERAVWYASDVGFKLLASRLGVMPLQRPLNRYM